MKIYSILIFSLLVVACASTKHQNNQMPKFTEIRFGRGGGFTGAEQNYILKSTGDVYKLEKDSTAFLNKISVSELKNISDKIQQMGFKDISLNKTGNMTYHIAVSTTDYTKRVTWSDQSVTPEIKDLYQTLVKTLKN